jgi:alpha-L-rhamnosidase
MKMNAPWLLVAALIGLTLRSAAVPVELSIAEAGAIGDGSTLNTPAIQSAIDRLAVSGGTLVVPKGVFLTGALFLKPGVNLRLEDGAVLKGSTNIEDYPKGLTRIEGHFEEWIPALVNAAKCDHLRLSGPGTLDGSGAPYWKEFWARRKVDPKTKNLDVPRPRLVFLQDSADVQISGVTFKDSAFWNLHLYRCHEVLVENSRFEVPDGVKCPSTDGTDVDSSQNVTIRGCTYRVNDDCIALKGSKGPFALKDTASAPVEHIRVRDCTFERGNAALTLGSEATTVRDVVVENCRVNGASRVACLKLRPDTAQDYEDLHFRGLTLTGTGLVIQIQPWKQYFDLKGQPPPSSIVRDLTLSNLKGSAGTFGTIQGNPGQTLISDLTLENLDLTLKNETLKVGPVANFTMKNVRVNGKPFSVQPAK